MPKPLTVRITTNWKILKEKGIPHHLTCLLRNLYAGQETTVRTGQGTTDWFQIGKEYVKAVFCHPAYMQNTSCEILGWMKHKLESRLQREISITSDMQMTPPSCQCRRLGFDPWVKKIPWRREWLPTPVFLPGELHGLYSPWGCKESDMNEQLSQGSIN